MKYPRQISMPSGIQLWLEEQLEARGVDARVYSNYILSVLSNDSSELSVKPKDRQVRILIDELRIKLKGLQEKGQFPKSDKVPKSIWGENSQSLQEEGFSYYSALPSSNSKAKSGQINSSVGSSPSIWSGKRTFGSSVGKNRTVSEGNNRDSKISCYWLEEDKENNGNNRDVKEKLRSRSTVKQQTPEKTNRNMAKSLDRKEDVSRRSDTNKSRRLYQQPNESANEFNNIFWKNEKPFDDLTGCDKDLPMDFQQLLESPESTKVSFDYSRLASIKQPPSFIQCGTNITSSIWSENAEDKMECSMTSEANNNVSIGLEKSAWGAMGEASVKIPTTELEPCSMFNISHWSTGNSNVFTNDSWKTVGNSKGTLGEIGKWSDVEGTSLLINDADNFFSSIGSNLHSSLTTLNHNKEDSSFTEVIPKMQSGFFGTKDIVNIEPAVNYNDITSSIKKDEEDLLTSMKTHFRPIKHEVVEVASSTVDPSFPDGTTFPISNRLDEPNFHKSPGGGLYLDSDVNKKYMAYNDAEDDTPSEFVPKFLVKSLKNEKFCQTDEFVPSAQNCTELESEEMYFPEDEKLVRSMVEGDEIEEEDENVFLSGETCIKVDGWMATWPTSGIWSNEPNVQQIWCGANVWSNNEVSTSVEGGGGGGGGGEEQYTQLCNEWTQEAEELLSDISQQLYMANYVDTQPPKTTLVESAWNQLSSTPFTRAVPLPATYSLMQS
ncbi:uncharacterized protein LOC128988064 isoform X2 [Macrosteles quadrilineatus]|uniref:uncharacterized protein LOC128988064 isoform X2 n=1 Tax=Macrosteles quadrilineatus TaxID=74068 RepID=UPI0023E2B1DC|nr:uncharacterized protein LOC128988064 isoform X2 [Macrosteles quadrilineatus]